MDPEDQSEKESNIFEVSFEDGFQAGIDWTTAARSRSVSPVKFFNQEYEDSWPLDDLYCDASSYLNNNMDDQMFALETKHEVLSWACAIITTSPTGRAMFTEAMNAGWELSLEDLGGLDYHLDVPEKRIVLDNNALLESALGRSEYFRNVVLISFIRALRDVWQEKRHGAFENYNAESVLKLERVRAADLDVMAVLVSWELRSEGVGNLWRHMIGSEEGDLAMRFSAYLERNPKAQFNGKALFAAFQQWFRDNARINNIDHETLNTMDCAIEEMGRDAYGSEKLTPVRLEILSCLPDKTAYLQRRGRELLMDPLYAGLNDPINQAHFMQVNYDLQITRVQDVPFRSASLAARIFPNGEFTPANDFTQDQ